MSVNITYTRAGPGRWRIRVELPRVNGERRFKYHTFLGEQASLRNEINSLWASYVSLERVGDIVSRHLDEATSSGDLSGQSAYTYQSMLRGGGAALAGLNVATTTESELADAVADVSDKYAAATAKAVLRVVTRAVEAYGKSGRVSEVWSSPPKIRGKALPRRGRALTAAEITYLLRCSRQHPAGPAVRFALATGCRRGEIVALNWGDFDFDSSPRTVSIDRTASYSSEGRIVGPPKSEAGRRTIDLPDAIATELQAYRRPFPDGAVFVNSRGDRWSTAGLSRAAADLFYKAGLPKSLRLHDLRHTHATALLSANVQDYAVAERLGHSSPAITRDIYAHATKADRDRATDVAGGLITE